MAYSLPMSATPWGSLPEGDPPRPPDGYSAPLPERPATTLKAFGVVAIVMAVLNGLGNVFAILMAALEGAGGATTPAPAALAPLATTLQALAEQAAMARKVNAVEGGVMLLMDAALIVVGILLLQRRELGRVSAIAWAITALAVLAARAVAFEIFLWPKIQRVFASILSAPAMPSAFGFMGSFAHVSSYLSLLGMALFPICCLCVMSLASVKAQVRERAL